ncbi:MAG: response regulator, partial [Anaerolineae bacterium]|nr:response regulator [Anaerolineae bacterium]
EVLTAPNGVAGLEKLRQEKIPPDLILSDIMMPHMNGYDFFQAVRSETRWHHTQFVFLTAKGERDDIMFGKELGTDDYVVKPFDAKDLLRTIEAKLRRRKQYGDFFDKEVSEIKRKVLTVINHEMRTPLTYVVAYADMLNRDAEDLTVEDMRSFLRGINVGANRLRRMVENFILLVELQAGEAKGTFAWRKDTLSNFAALLRQIESKYTDLAAEKQTALVIEVEDDLPTITADSDYLNTAMECMVDNAIKFTEKPEKTITLRAYRQGDVVCISVKDEGRGIPEEELHLIWQMFYQVDRETYEDQGAGAGLPIVAGVAELHGGHASVESKKDEGSTFTLHLPIKPATEETKQESPAETG